MLNILALALLQFATLTPGANQPTTTSQVAITATSGTTNIALGGSSGWGGDIALGGSSGWGGDIALGGSSGWGGDIALGGSSGWGGDIVA